MDLTRRELLLGLVAAPAIAAAAPVVVSPPRHTAARWTFDPCRFGYKVRVIQGGGPGQFLTLRNRDRDVIKIALWPTGECFIPAQLVDQYTTMYVSFEGGADSPTFALHYSNL